MPKLYDAQAAQRFLNKALRSVKSYHRPRNLNTDKDHAYISAFEALSAEEHPFQHRQIKYQNNRIEFDHGKLKRFINAVQSFQSKRTAYATIKRFKVMRIFKKDQLDMWYYKRGIAREVFLIENQFTF